MNNRIQDLRKLLNISLTEMGRQIGLKPSTMCDIVHGRCNITERVIISICARFNVNEEWLRNGTGKVFKDSIKYDEFFTTFKSLSEPLQQFLIDTAKHLLDLQDNHSL